jgi:hypothetical protein
MIVEELAKAEKKKVFFEPCFSCFLLYLSSLFDAEIIRFLRLIRSLHNVKFVHSLSDL